MQECPWSYLLNIGDHDEAHSHFCQWIEQLQLMGNEKVTLSYMPPLCGKIHLLPAPLLWENPTSLPYTSSVFPPGRRTDKEYTKQGFCIKPFLKINLTLSKMHQHFPGKMPPDFLGLFVLHQHRFSILLDTDRRTTDVPKPVLQKELRQADGASMAGGGLLLATFVPFPLLQGRALLLRHLTPRPVVTRGLVSSHSCFDQL